MVSAVLGLVDGEPACGVVAELFSDTFAVDVAETVADDAARVPVAPDAVALTFAVAVGFPEAFARHFPAHAVGIEAAAHKEDGTFVF